MRLEPNTSYYVASFEDTVNYPAELFSTGGTATPNAEFIIEAGGSFTVEANQYGVNLQNAAPQAWATIGTTGHANVNLQIQ